MPPAAADWQPVTGLFLLTRWAKDVAPDKVLPEYPATTATDKCGLQRGQKFTLRLPLTVEVWGVRVVAKPSSGDNLKQAFVACSELEAFAD